MGRTVLITGASGGIGKAAALAFARQGDKVALGCCHNKEKAEAVRQEILQQGGQALVVQADVAHEKQVERMFTEIETAFGPVEVLVNNAGIAQQKLFTELSLEDWNRMFAVHVTGSFLCSRCALAAMIQKKHGCIVNISSMWGQVGASCEVHYSAAKAALIGFTKALAQEVGPSNIRVNCVAPGVVETDMMADFSAADKQALCEETPLQCIGLPEDIAASILFLSSPGAGFITGQVLAPNGGYVI